MTIVSTMQRTMRYSQYNTLIGESVGKVNGESTSDVLAFTSLLTITE